MKLVGRYQVLSRLGQGAMAHVYRAHDPEIQRDLAIKILNQQYRSDPECVGRFLREARAAGALSHPNIVTIFDVGEAQGIPYIAMELLTGETLDKVMETRGAFPVQEVVRIGTQLANALRYAHDLDIVHRDIKPSNIMLADDGTVKILDFGIARVAESSAQEKATAVLQTQIGQVLGTPRYMSPEQALGHEIDGRSDLFSLGVVLYELICGRPAFEGTSVATIAIQIATQEPAPISVTPECPRGLRFIIEKLLEKKPEKRFDTGAQLTIALAREAAALDIAADEGRNKRIPLHLRFTMLASAVVAAVLTLGIGAILDQQYRAMERVAITSGSSIAAFVASNTALTVVENATLAPEQADWAPVQAFINTASTDANITGMLVVDRDGFVRGASDPKLIGSLYRAESAKRTVDGGLSVSSERSMAGGEIFRFTRPIVYAEHMVGLVEVGVRKDELQAAAALTRNLLIGLGMLMMAVVLSLSFLAGRVVLSPIRRLNAALRDAARGNLDFRITHNRRDEFGELFDSFNAAASEFQKKFERASDPKEAAESAAMLLQTVIRSRPTMPFAPAREGRS